MVFAIELQARELQARGISISEFRSVLNLLIKQQASSSLFTNAKIFFTIFLKLRISPDCFFARPYISSKESVKLFCFNRIWLQRM